MRSRGGLVCFAPVLVPTCPAVALAPWSGVPAGRWVPDQGKARRKSPSSLTPRLWGRESPKLLLEYLLSLVLQRDTTFPVSNCFQNQGCEGALLVLLATRRNEAEGQINN